MIIDVKGTKMYIDKTMNSNLDYVMKYVYKQKNWHVGICDGRPSTGKSTLIAQLAYKCSDGKLTLKDECFTSKQFDYELDNTYIGRNIILDEAFDVYNKRNTLSKDSFLALSKLQKMRAKQIFVWVVLPSVYDLDKNIILNLADIFVHCYKVGYHKKGYYWVMDRERLRQLWLKNRQSYSYNLKDIKPNFWGRFTKFFPLDEKAYEKKKYSSNDYKEENIFLARQRKQRNDVTKLYFTYLKDNTEWKAPQIDKFIADQMGVSPYLINRWRNNIEEIRRKKPEVTEEVLQVSEELENNEVEEDTHENEI